MSKARSTPQAQYLFSYGTLQLEAVQRSTFGRLLDGTPDRLPGFAQSLLRIEDENVRATSGSADHPILKYTGRAADVIDGTVFRVSADELQMADRYEVAAYRRVAVVLASGTRAWVYVDARFAPPGA
ncbi:MAG: gamma-glutamylcyclotransferase [Burkholderiaceae bacterium]|nr:gamma-glutamylcyclotransferase [Burkholderiaceae bacterium]